MGNFILSKHTHELYRYSCLPPGLLCHLLWFGIVLLFSWIYTVISIILVYLAVDQRNRKWTKVFSNNGLGLQFSCFSWSPVPVSSLSSINQSLLLQLLSQQLNKSTMHIRNEEALHLMWASECRHCSANGLYVTIQNSVSVV